MKNIRRAVLLFIVMLLLTGIVYPALVTVIAQILFPWQAGGSVMYKADGLPIGSAVIGQPFSDPKYFWSRPSATTDFPYNSLASGGSNLGPTNKNLVNQIAHRVKALRESGIQGQVPADLVTASGSGLDPHISLESALVQVPRIARVRHIPEEKIKALVKDRVEGSPFGSLGTPRVNVLQLNLDLEEL